eukprot:Opistho-2@24027
MDPLVILPAYIAGISWTLVYDTIYAHQDKKDDALVGVKSTALRFGDNTRPWLSLFAVSTIGGLALSGANAGLAWPFYASLAAGAAHLAWQIKTVDVSSPSDCMAKFCSNRDFGGIVLAGIVAGRFFS